MVPKFQGCTVKGKALSVQASRIPSLIARLQGSKVPGLQDYSVPGFYAGFQDSKVAGLRVP
jgi:hypothetical protein